MDKKIIKFQDLAQLFSQNGYSLYLVGGSVRDYLLKKDLTDLDVTTDATPNDMKKFLENADYTFERMGFVKCKFQDCKFDITTLRKEQDYSDFRHPKEVIFVDSPKEDYKRRDFTINALYLTKDLTVLDYVEGKKDLENHTIKMVGDPFIRLKEDPLRILRALRFSLLFNFKIDPKLEEAIKHNINLLVNLNSNKIKEEIKKIKGVDNNRIDELFNHFSIKYILKVVD